MTFKSYRDHYGGLARWKHVVIHGCRLEEEHCFRETENRLKYMGDICDVLDVDRGDIPDYTTLNKSFDRFKMWVWRALLCVSAQQLPQSGFAALDSTFFDRYDQWPFTYQSLYRRVKRGAREADRVDEGTLRPHALRATAAEYRPGRGLSLPPLMTLFGWRRLAIGEPYPSGSDANTQRALREIHGV